MERENKLSSIVLGSAPDTGWIAAEQTPRCYFGLTQFPCHTQHPFPTIPTSGRCPAIPMEKLKWEGLLVPCSFDPHIYPSRQRSFQGCWEDAEFLFFLSHSPRACNGLLGVGKGGDDLGRKPQGLKYSPEQHNHQNLAPSSPTSVPASPSGAWHSRKRF